MSDFTDPILQEWVKDIHLTTRKLVENMRATNDPLMVIRILDIDYNGGLGTYAGRDADRLRDMLREEREYSRAENQRLREELVLAKLTQVVMFKPDEDSPAMKLLDCSKERLRLMTTLRPMSEAPEGFGVRVLAQRRASLGRWVIASRVEGDGWDIDNVICEQDELHGWLPHEMLQTSKELQVLLDLDVKRGVSG